MLLTLARSIGDVDEVEVDSPVRDFTFDAGERLTADEEMEIARRSFVKNYTYSKCRSFVPTSSRPLKMTSNIYTYVVLLSRGRKNLVKEIASSERASGCGGETLGRTGPAHCGRTAGRRSAPPSGRRYVYRRGSITKSSISLLRATNPVFSKEFNGQVLKNVQRFCAVIGDEGHIADAFIQQKSQHRMDSSRLSCWGRLLT